MLTIVESSARRIFNAFLSTCKFEIISIWNLSLKFQANSQPQIVNSEKNFFFPKWLIF